MKAIENMKFIQNITPVTDADGGAQTCATIDTLGYTHLRFLLNLGTLASSGTLNAKLAETDDSDGSTGLADITGAAIAQIAAGSHTNVYAIDLDLTKGVRKRYIKPVVVASVHSVAIGAIAILSGSTAGDHDGLATDAGLTQKVSK